MCPSEMVHSQELLRLCLLVQVLHVNAPGEESVCVCTCEGSATCKCVLASSACAVGVSWLWFFVRPQMVQCGHPIE